MTELLNTGRPYRLFIPGPVEVSHAVISKLAHPIVPHYGAEWTALYREATHMAQTVFGTEGSVFLIPGSSSSGLDAAVGALTLPGEETIVPDTGLFGQRLADIARSRGLIVHAPELSRSQALTPEQLKTFIAEHPEARSVLLVHSETSTGVLNPIELLAPVVKGAGLRFIVDAVSSIGTVPFKMDEWQVDATVTGSQKGLAAPAGVALVALRTEAERWMAERREPISGWYLNLQTWRHYEEIWSDWHPFPVTLPCNLFLALHQALHEALDEGLDARYARHQQVALFLRERVEAAGFRSVADAASASPSVSVLQVPEGLNSLAVQEYLKDHWGMLVATGFGLMKEKAVRVGHMGGAAFMNSARALAVALEDAAHVLSHRSGV